MLVLCRPSECDNFIRRYRRSSSHRSQGQTLVENRDFWSSYGVSCRNIAKAFGTEKPEWCGHLVVKRYVYSFRQNTRT